MVFFGEVTWQTVANQALKQRVGDLDAIAAVYQNHHGYSDSALAVDHYLNRNNFFFIADGNGKLVNASLPAPLIDHIVWPLLARLHSRPNDKSPLVRRGWEYAWISRPLPHDEGRVFFVNRAREVSAGSYFSSMGPPILAAAFVIMWAIFWGGTYLARIFDQLDEQRKKLKFLALNDSLTGLPNRSLFQDRFTQVLEEAERYPQNFALAIVDLNRFKEINDLLGHEFGDAVLREMGRRFSAALRKCDTVARLGGDEFALLMPRTDMLQAEMVVERVVQGFHKPVTIGGQQLQVNGSIGLALYPLHGRDTDSLARAADLAMYECKQLKNRYVVYDPQHHEGRNNLVLLQKLLRAIDEQAFELYYQPQICIQTGAVKGMEVLLRWRDGDERWVCTEEFVSLAEQTGHIRHITRWVFERAIRDYSRFQKRGHRLRVAINLSTCDLVDDSLFNYLAELLHEHDIDPRCVILEMTESAVASNPRRVGENLNRLVRELQLAVSIDDFGTGYSSLSHLQQMTISELKIDRAFVRTLKRGQSDYQIVKGIIHLAHDLGLSVVAEGVESEDVLVELRRLRCDTAQGYHVARPMSCEAMLNWLDERVAEMPALSGAGARA